MIGVGATGCTHFAVYCRAGTRTPTTRARIWRAANYTTRQRDGEQYRARVCPPATLLGLHAFQECMLVATLEGGGCPTVVRVPTPSDNEGRLEWRTPETAQYSSSKQILSS